MARPSKLTHEIQQRIGDNIALGLTYAWLPSRQESLIKHSIDWMQRGQKD